MPFVYMLECEDASYYVGSTVLLEERVQQHQLGLGADYTRCRLPVKLVWFEEHEHIGAAFAREKQIQNWGRRKRRALIEGRYGDLPALARRRGASQPERSD
jgi:putative endonuclease